MGIAITVILVIACRCCLEYLVIFEVDAVSLIYLFYLISSSSDPIMYFLQCCSVLCLLESKNLTTAPFNCDFGVETLEFLCKGNCFQSATV